MDIHDKLLASLSATATDPENPPADGELRVMVFQGERPMLVPVEALREMFAPEALPLEPVLSEPIDLTPITEALESHDGQLKAVRARVRTIESALQPSSPTPTPTPKLGVFEVKADFDPAKLPGELPKRYAAARAALANYARTGVDMMIQGKMAYSGANGKENWGKVVHIKDMRFAQTYVESLLAFMHVFGDPWAAKELARVMSGLVDRTVRTYAPGANVKMPAGNERRWIMFPGEVFTEETAGGFVFTDLMLLEGDLAAGTIVEALRGLLDNLDDPECKAAHTKLLTFYTEDWRPRRHAISLYNRPKSPAYLYGSGLTHPTVSRYMEYALMAKMYGRDEDIEAEVAYRAWLEADHHIVEAPNGAPVMTWPQGCQGRYREMTGKGNNSGAGWMVYLRESFPNYEVGLWCDLPLFKPEMAEAIAGTLEWTLPALSGPDKDPYAKDIGGGPARTSDRNVVQFRDGSSVKGKWPIIQKGAEGQGSHSLASGLSHISAYRSGSERLEKEMQGLLERHGSKGHAGITVPLLVWEASRHGLI